MMSWLNNETIFLFLTFFVPGFVSFKVHDLFIPGERRDYQKSLYAIFAYSAINFALIGSVFDPLNLREFGSKWFIATIIIPAAWPIIYVKVSSWNWPRRFILTRWIMKEIRHPIPQPWDEAFRQGEDYWVVVNLKEGQKLFGYFGDKSFVSSYPSPEQIYFEETYIQKVDGTWQKIEGTKGTIVMGTEILSIELYDAKEETKGEGKKGLFKRIWLWLGGKGIPTYRDNTADRSTPPSSDDRTINSEGSR